MKAIVIDEAHPDRPLVYRNVPDPEPGPDDLLVSVRAAGTSRADLRKVGTHFAASEKRASAVTGLEFAGEVVATGANVKGFACGDRVMAFNGGANAELALVDYRVAMPVPRALTWEEAAAVPISFLTAYNAVFDAAKLRPGESILFQGGSSSVGIAAMQMARRRGAGTIFGTASTPEKLSCIRELGCDVPINYREEDVAAVIARKTDSIGVDIVIDLIGGPTAPANIASAAIKGRIVCVGRIEDLATINLNEFSRKRLTMIGVTFRTRTMDERVDIVRRFCADMLPEFERRAIFPIVARSFPMAEAERALQQITDHAEVGKVILRP